MARRFWPRCRCCPARPTRRRASRARASGSSGSRWCSRANAICRARLPTRSRSRSRQGSRFRGRSPPRARSRMWISAHRWCSDRRSAARAGSRSGAAATARTDAPLSRSTESCTWAGIEQADGNHVILALGHGRFAFYAYLEPGSVRVKPGARVRRGQVIARLGNSGSSSGLHLHFQVMDRPSALACGSGSPEDLIVERDEGADHRPSVEPAPAAATGATGASIRVSKDTVRRGVLSTWPPNDGGAALSGSCRTTLVRATPGQEDKPRQRRSATGANSVRHRPDQHPPRREWVVFSRWERVLT